MSKILLPGCVILSVLLSGCFPEADLLVANRVYVSYRVDFQPNGPPPMKTITPRKNCSKGVGNRFGCMKFANNEYGSIAFGLSGETDYKKCGDPGTNWVITKIEATDQGNLSGDTKGTDWGTPLESWIKDSFFPLDDPVKGVLYEATLDNAQTTAGLFNKNINSGEEDLWYKITATKCDAELDGSHKTNQSDPRVENDGL